MPRSALFTAWLAVSLLWPVALLNYLDRQMLATAKRSVTADVPTIRFDTDGTDRANERFGNLMAAFMWVYAAVSPLGGFVADRFGRRRAVVASLLVWSAVTFATGRATTYDDLWWLRAAMGLSEAFYFPAALALIADHHRGPTRTRATALHQTGVYAGMALGGLGGYFADHWSWRVGFQACGGIGVLYAVLLALVLPGTPASDDTVAARPRPADTARVLASTPAFWLLVVYFTLPATGGWAVRNWLPDHVAGTFTLSQTASGFLATGCTTAGNVIGAVFGGFVADWLSRRTSRGRVFTGVAGALLCVPTLTAIGFTDGLPLLVVVLVLYGVGWGLFDANNMPILCQLVGPAYRATGYGVMNLVSISAGAGFTVLMGRMKDGGIGFEVAFSIGAGVTLLGVTAGWLIRPRVSETVGQTG